METGLYRIGFISKIYIEKLNPFRYKPAVPYKYSISAIVQRGDLLLRCYMLEPAHDSAALFYGTNIAKKPVRSVPVQACTFIYYDHVEETGKLIYR